MHHEKDACIFACHIAGVYDVNRNNTIQPDDYSQVKDWVNAIKDLNLNAILFHNNFSEKTIAKNQDENVAFIKIEHDVQYNPNVFRYFVYRDYLQHYGQTIRQVFLTDVSDVVVVKNPFTDEIFLQHPDTIFCGDEPKLLNNEWMHAHSSHLRSKIGDYSSFESDFKDEILLNCGIIGGEVNIMKFFLDELCLLHEQFNRANKTAYTGDMGTFNYVARRKFNLQLYHGFPVNTVFKGYEKERTDCWFRHK
jgi:hypothetical protein